MMEITIHDVGHGACTVVSCPNGARYMIDCGRKADRSWTPSRAYAGQFVDRLIIQNLDEDHVEDLPEVLKNVRIQSIYSNPNVDASALLAMKPDGMRAGVNAAWHHLHTYGPGHAGPIPNAGDVVAVSHFCSYPVPFKDTNNLSVVTFFGWRGFGILFGGDLEEAGWKELLARPSFKQLLPFVRVFVASHHGRLNGTHDGLFDAMHPDIAVISDDRIQYSTQNTTTWYQRRVKGIPVEGTYGLLGPERRWVYTTRSDGSLKIKVSSSGFYTIFVGQEDVAPGQGGIAEALAALGR